MITLEKCLQIKYLCITCQNMFILIFTSVGERQKERERNEANILGLNL